MIRRVGLGLSLCFACLLVPTVAQAASGQWERTWGADVDSALAGTGFEICTVAASCKAGDGLSSVAGAVDGPTGVAVDGSGNVYVVDAFKFRVQKFDSNGNFQRMWGKDVDTAAGTGPEICTVAPNCQIGSQATSLGGEFGTMDDIAVDNAGNVYVADSGKSRIQKFDSNGSFLRAWGLDVDTGGGTGFETCLSAASCKAAAATTGLGGEMSSPNGIAVDANNNVYVADGSSTNRVHKFDSQGTWLRTWGKDVDSIAAGTGFEICIVAANCKNAAATTGFGGEMNDPSKLEADANGVYVPDVSNHRVQRFDSNGNFQRAWGKDVEIGGGTGAEICTVAANCKLGTIGGSAGELSIPSGIATDASGAVYVSEFSNHRISKFDANGSFQRMWGQNVVSAGPGNTGTTFEICVAPADTCQTGGTNSPTLGGETINPGGMDIDAAGTLYLTEGGIDRVSKFAADPPPETAITSGPGTSTTATPSFGFTSDPGSTFECSLDGGAFAACTSPFTTPALANGAHSLSVRATDPARQVEATPETRNFTVDVPADGGGGGGGDGGGGGGGGNGGGGGGGADTDAPETTIDSGPKAKRSGKATFEFSSDEAGSTFECKLDKVDFERCSSPRKLKKLKAGKHTFQVRAIDAAGNEDASPAKSKFAIPSKRKRR